MKLILASGSPRRAQLLKRMGFEFEQKTSGIKETHEAGIKPHKLALDLAKQKCNDIAAKNPFDLVIGADTIVARNDIIYGKPIDASDAKKTLLSLSNAQHDVITGIWLKSSENDIDEGFFVVTKVFFTKIDEKLANWYVNTGEPFDKAGAYGIQGKGCLLVERIEGDYDNVVGLPIAMLTKKLISLGIHLGGLNGSY